MDEQKSEQNADYLDGEGDKGCIMNHSSESSEQNDTSCSREREVSPIKCDVNIPNDSIDGSPSDNVSEDVVDKCIRVTVEQNESFCSLNSEGSGVCNDENGSMNERQVETLLRAPTRTDVGKKERLDTEEKDTSLLMSESYLRDESVVEFTVDSKDEDESTDGEEQVDVLQYTSENIKDVSSETETTEENKSLESLNSDEKLPPLHLLPQEIKNASLLTEIEDLLTTTACSPDSGFEVSKIDVSSTSKENLMKMISSLLDECDTLKKEKTR